MGILFRLLFTLVVLALVVEVEVVEDVDEAERVILLIPIRGWWFELSLLVILFCSG